MKEYKITTINRLDKELVELRIGISREAIQKMIKKEKILVNGKPTKASYRTSVGDVVTVEESIQEENTLKPQEISIDVIYEDEDILIVNKPKGMVVHPGNGNPDGTLANAAIAHCIGKLSSIGGRQRMRNST